MSRWVTSALLLAVSCAGVLTSPSAAAAEHRPRRNLRVAIAMGPALLVPPLICSDCDSFWGRALSVVVEVGWTVRPDLVLSLEEQVTGIYFADGTDGTIGGFQLSARYFRNERVWILGAAGVGLRGVSKDQRPDFGVRIWEQAGPMVTVGAGYEPGRWKAWSFDVQARATAVFAGGVAPGVLLMVGGAWN